MSTFCHKLIFVLFEFILISKRVVLAYYSFALSKNYHRLPGMELDGWNIKKTPNNRNSTKSAKGAYAPKTIDTATIAHKAQPHRNIPIAIAIIMPNTIVAAIATHSSTSTALRSMITPFSYYKLVRFNCYDSIIISLILYYFKYSG